MKTLEKRSIDLDLNRLKDRGGSGSYGSVYIYSGTLDGKVVEVAVKQFNSQYDCLMFGYQESMNKMEQIGRDEINKHNMFIRFTCTPEQII